MLIDSIETSKNFNWGIFPSLALSVVVCDVSFFCLLHLSNFSGDFIYRGFQLSSLSSSSSSFIICFVSFVVSFSTLVATKQIPMKRQPIAKWPLQCIPHSLCNCECVFVCMCVDSLEVMIFKEWETETEKGKNLKQLILLCNEQCFIYSIVTFRFIWNWHIQW